MPSGMGAVAFGTALRAGAQAAPEVVAAVEAVRAGGDSIEQAVAEEGAAQVEQQVGDGEGADQGDQDEIGAMAIRQNQED